MNTESPSRFNPHNRKKVHIPFMDVDDLAYNRQDPKFVASITDMMQVPSSITINGNSSTSNQRIQPQNVYYNNFEPTNFHMDVPEKLTINQADEVLNARESQYSSTNSLAKEAEASSRNNTTVTPPSTPTKVNFDEDLFTGRTPQMAEDLFNRMKTRRSSIEVDLHTEIRNLRDRVNNLEHNCQVNTRSAKVFYSILIGYCLMKTFGWFVRAN